MDMILQGDAHDLPLEDESVDAVVTDPPYGLHFMGKDWDQFRRTGVGDHKETSERTASMHAGQYDHDRNPEYQTFMESVGKECLRVLKPGGHLLSFGGTRTIHRLITGLEDAGFEIRDQIVWLYGQGFPKSHNVANAIADKQGTEKVEKPHPTNECDGGKWCDCDGRDERAQSGATRHPPTYEYPEESDATKWDGWGTALKPSHEPLVLARKPLVGTVAENVLEHGTGALNIDDCRIATVEDTRRTFDLERTDTHEGWDSPWMQEGERTTGGHSGGRWPANTVLSHAPGCRPRGWRRVKGSDPKKSRDPISDDNTLSGGSRQGGLGGYGTEVVTSWTCVPGCPVAELDRQSGVSSSHRNRKSDGRIHAQNEIYGEGIGWGRHDPSNSHADQGGASRFYYTSKASRSEREAGLDAEDDDIANRHPTVKPVDIMRWLVRLVAPPEGTVLDPFAGSGTTGIACVLEDFDFIGIEKEAEYARIAEARIAHAESNPTDYADDDNDADYIQAKRQDDVSEWI